MRLHISYLVLALVALTIGLPFIVAIGRASSSDRPRPFYEAVTRFPTWAKILSGVVACIFVYSIALGYAVARLGSHMVDESQITQPSYLRTASVVPVPRGNSGIDISISPHQNRTMLEYGFARFKVRNMTEKPVSMLVGGAYSAFGMRFPKAAQSDPNMIHHIHAVASLENFVTIRPHQSVETDFDILRYLSDLKHALGRVGLSGAKQAVNLC